MSAEVLAEFVEETTGLQSALLRTSRISHLFFAAAALLLTVAGCQRTVGLHRALGFFYFSKLWALLSMVRSRGRSAGGNGWIAGLCPCHVLGADVGAHPQRALPGAGS